VSQKRDTIGELKSVEICVSHMPSLKANKLRMSLLKLPVVFSNLFVVGSTCR
jgi:hypothetical protein